MDRRVSGTGGGSPLITELDRREPERSSDLSSLPFQGLAPQRQLLQSLYVDAAESVVYRWIREHP